MRLFWSIKLLPHIDENGISQQKGRLQTVTNLSDTVPTAFAAQIILKKLDSRACIKVIDILRVYAVFNII